MCFEFTPNSSLYFGTKKSVQGSEENLVSSESLVQSSCPHLDQENDNNQQLFSKKRDSHEHHTSSPELSSNRDSPNNMVDAKSASSSSKTDPFLDNSNGTISVNASTEIVKINGKFIISNKMLLPTNSISYFYIEPSKLFNELTVDPSRLSPRSFSATNSNTSSSTSLTAQSGSSTLARQWSSPKTVELLREPDQGLGISIVGGRVDLFNLSPGHSIGGIFIKNVLPGSPAAKSGLLKRGDHILEVDGKDLRNATRNEAVEAIRSAKNPVKFVVCTLLSLPRDEEVGETGKTSDSIIQPPNTFANEHSTEDKSMKNSSSECINKANVTTIEIPGNSYHRRTPSPVVIQEGLDDEALQQEQARLETIKFTPIQKDDEDDEEDIEVQEKTQQRAPKIIAKTKTVSLTSEPTESESDEEINVRDTKGKVFTKAGVEVRDYCK